MCFKMPVIIKKKPMSPEFVEITKILILIFVQDNQYLVSLKDFFSVSYCAWLMESYPDIYVLTGNFQGY